MGGHRPRRGPASGLVRRAGCRAHRRPRSLRPIGSARAPVDPEARPRHRPGRGGGPPPVAPTRGPGRDCEGPPRPLPRWHGRHGLRPPSTMKPHRRQHRRPPEPVRWRGASGLMAAVGRELLARPDWRDGWSGCRPRDEAGAEAACGRTRVRGGDPGRPRRRRDRVATPSVPTGAGVLGPPAHGAGARARWAWAPCRSRQALCPWPRAEWARLTRGRWAGWPGSIPGPLPGNPAFALGWGP